MSGRCSLSRAQVENYPGIFTGCLRRSALAFTARPSPRSRAVRAARVGARPGAGHHGRERGCRVPPAHLGPGAAPRPPSPRPALCPERPRHPRERSPGYHRLSAGPKAGGDRAASAGRAPGPGRASKTPGPAPRHGGGAATRLTEPERRRDRPGSRFLPPPGTPVTGPQRGHRAQPGPATHRPRRSPRRAAPRCLNVPAPPPSPSGSEAAYGPRQGPEGLTREAFAPLTDGAAAAHRTPGAGPGPPGGLW